MFKVDTYQGYTIVYAQNDQGYESSFCILKDDSIIYNSKDIKFVNGETNARLIVDGIINKNQEYDRGFQDGYSAAEDAAENFGLSVTYDQAFKAGKAEGRTEALAEPLKNYDEGFRAGEQVGRAESEHKVAELTKTVASLKNIITEITNTELVKVPEKWGYKPIPQTCWLCNQDMANMGNFSCGNNECPCRVNISFSSGEEIERRPVTCRNRLRDEGEPYPRSGCQVCGNGGLVGCQFEKEWGTL